MSMDFSWQVGLDGMVLGLCFHIAVNGNITHGIFVQSVLNTTAKLFISNLVISAKQFQQLLHRSHHQ